MGKIIGYTRVSTMRQKLQRQIDNIKAVYPDADILEEKYTGTSLDRPVFNALMKQVEEGKISTIVFDSVSRMSRTAEEGYNLYMYLYNKGVDLVFLKEPTINTSVFRETVQIAMTGSDADVILEGVNKYLMILAKKQVKIAFDQAEKEVTDLHGRISEGIRQSIKKYDADEMLGLPHDKNRPGRQKGRAYTSKKSVDMKRKILGMSKDFSGGMNDKEVIETLHISRNTFYKYKRELINK